MVKPDAKDVAVIIIFLGLFTLKVMKIDGVVDALLLSVVSGYLGYSIAMHPRVR